MKYGVKYYSQVPNPDEVPDAWPASTVKYQDDDIKLEQQLIDEDFTIQTENEFIAYIALHQEEYDAWVAIHNIDNIRQKLRDQIDIKSGELIYNGFPYTLDGKTFRARCNDEDQRNYTGLIISKDMLPYEGEGRPQLKGYLEDGTSVFAYFSNALEVVYFYMTGVQHVNNMLNDGWKIKDIGGTLSTGQVITTPIKNMSYEDLLNFVDPRT